MNSVPLIVIFSFALSFTSIKFDAIKVGLTETMGIIGMVNVSYEFEDLSSENNKFNLTAGVFPIPILGGLGLGYKRYFTSFNINPITDINAKPYTAITVFSNYILPFCDNCSKPIKYGLMATGALGCDVHIIKEERLNVHLQLGLMTHFDLIEGKVFESPSDIPEIWPTINLKFYGTGLGKLIN